MFFEEVVEGGNESFIFPQVNHPYPRLKLEGVVEISEKFREFAKKLQC
jgi:hypothetical protein